MSNQGGDSKQTKTDALVARLRLLADQSRQLGHPKLAQQIEEKASLIALEQGLADQAKNK